MHPLRQSRLAAWCGRYRVPLLLTVAMIPTLVRCVLAAYDFDPFDTYPSLSYYIGYETGFGGRKLLGTVFNWLLPYHVGLSTLRPIFIGINFLLVGLTVLLISLAGRRGTRRQLPVLLFAIVYLLGPFSVPQLVDSQLSIGFVESYMIILTLVWTLAYLHWRGRWWYYVLTLVVAAVCCLIHHTYCCLYFPLMVGLFVLDATEGGRIDRGKAVAYGAICLLMAALLAVIWRFSAMNVPLDELYGRISDRAAVNAWASDKDALDWVYYYTNGQNRARAFAHAGKYVLLVAVELLTLLPLLVVMTAPWIIAARSVDGGGIIRWRYIVACAAQNLMIVPIFFMATDTDRWWAAIFFCQFAMVLVAVVAGDGGIRRALASLCAWARRHWLLSLLFVLYLFQLKGLSIGGLHITHSIANYLRALLGI